MNDHEMRLKLAATVMAGRYSALSDTRDWTSVVAADCIEDADALMNAASDKPITLDQDARIKDLTAACNSNNLRYAEMMGKLSRLQKAAERACENLGPNPYCLTHWESAGELREALEASRMVPPINIPPGQAARVRELLSDVLEKAYVNPHATQQLREALSLLAEDEGEAVSPSELPKQWENRQLEAQLAAKDTRVTDLLRVNDELKNEGYAHSLALTEKDKEIEKVSRVVRNYQSTAPKLKQELCRLRGCVEAADKLLEAARGAYNYLTDHTARSGVENGAIRDAVIVDLDKTITEYEQAKDGP